MEDIRKRAEEWQTVHRAMFHDDEQVIFTFQRVVYEDDASTQEIVVACECGDAEMVGVAEIDEENPDQLRWYTVREEPN